MSFAAVVECRPPLKPLEPLNGYNVISWNRCAHQYYNSWLVHCHVCVEHLFYTDARRQLHSYKPVTVTRQLIVSEFHYQFTIHIRFVDLHIICISSCVSSYPFRMLDIILTVLTLCTAARNKSCLLYTSPL